jgi:hypothetical protein
VYNIAAGRTIPRWLDDKKKKALRRDEDYRKRVEILQVSLHRPSSEHHHAARPLKGAVRGWPMRRI